MFPFIARSVIYFHKVTYGSNCCFFAWVIIFRKDVLKNKERDY